MTQQCLNRRRSKPGCQMGVVHCRTADCQNRLAVITPMTQRYHNNNDNNRQSTATKGNMNPATGCHAGQHRTAEHNEAALPHNQNNMQRLANMCTKLRSYKCQIYDNAITHLIQTEILHHYRIHLRGGNIYKFHHRYINFSLSASFLFVMLWFKPSW